MNKLISLSKQILLYLRISFFKYKFKGLFLIVLPFWLMYGIYYTYYDETTKNAVIFETKQISNYIGGNTIIEYISEEKIVSFNSKIYIANKDKDCIEKYRKFLMENGYKKIDCNLWSKNKYSIREYHNDRYTIINIWYIRKKVKQ